jgi:hypothetical protein
LVFDEKRRERKSWLGRYLSTQYDLIADSALGSRPPSPARGTFDTAEVNRMVYTFVCVCLSIHFDACVEA